MFLLLIRIFTKKYPVLLKKNIQGLQPLGLQPLGWSPLKPKPFLDLAVTIPIIDTRSPSEYSQGHIPGAHNLPLFSDQERAIVGTTYTKNGPDEALIRGLDFVGPKMSMFVTEAKKLAVDDKILVHCWRGGMRSGAMAWLLGFAGLKPSVLTGGYKAYRKHIRESFSSGPEIRVLGGMTGSGKTEVLHQLSAMGHQVIDLEGLAHHKGSAFGWLGQQEQPTNEQFENNLAEKWLSLNQEMPVWIEDESRNVGKVIIPDGIFEKMNSSTIVFIDVPFEERVKRLTGEYGAFDRDDLVSILQKISKRIGGDTAKSAIESLHSGEVRNAVAAVLRYYDKTYEYGLSKRNPGKVIRMTFEEFKSSGFQGSRT